jgi:oligoendopeptidase F
VLEAAMQAEPLARYRPWLEDIRKDKPFQLDDKIEQLFHEKSVTGRAAWNRPLSTRPSRRLRFDVRGEELTLEPTLNKLQDADGTLRRDAAEALAQGFKGEPAHLHAHHQHAVEGSRDLGPLARLRGRRRFAPPRQPRPSARWSRLWSPP